MKQPPLEDSIIDILGKSRTGLGLEVAALSGRCGLSAERLQEVLVGRGTAEEYAVVAPVLGLDAEKLKALAEGRSYREEILPPAGLRMFTTAFGDMLVNSFLVWDEESGEAAAFDTGADAGEMLDFAGEKGVGIGQVFLTHAHGDHVFDLDRLLEKTGAAAWIGERENFEGAQPFAAGRTFAIGRLAVSTRLTWGHAVGGISYVIEGLDLPVAVVGDAIFAGSVGGGKVSYGDALRTIREELFSLPPQTLFCPGHGPLTTMAREQQNNPFF